MLLEEGLELWPYDENGAFEATLVLSLFEADGTMEKSGSKKGIIHLCDAWGFEIILIFLTKVVAIHVTFSKIGFRDPSLEWALSWL